MVLVLGNQIFHSPIADFPLALRLDACNHTILDELQRFGQVIHPDDNHVSCLAGIFNGACRPDGVGCIGAKDAFEVRICLKGILGQAHSLFEIVIIRLLKDNFDIRILCNGLLETLDARCVIGGGQASGPCGRQNQSLRCRTCRR